MKPHIIWKKVGITLLSLLLFFVCSGLLYVTKLANSAAPAPQEDIADITNPHVEEEAKEKMGGLLDGCHLWRGQPQRFL